MIYFSDGAFNKDHLVYLYILYICTYIVNGFFCTATYLHIL